jgi:hypothetical protein
LEKIDIVEFHSRNWGGRTVSEIMEGRQAALQHVAGLDCLLGLSDRFEAKWLAVRGKKARLKTRSWNRKALASVSQASFPFQFAIGRDDIPRAVPVEQLPL